MTGWKQWAVVLGAAVLSWGCGAYAENQPEISAEAGEPVGEVEQTALVGCAAIKVISETHYGALYYGAPNELYIQELNWKIQNPSSVACPSLNLVFELRDDINGTLLKRATLNVAMPANWNKRVYWRPTYNSTLWYVDTNLKWDGHMLKTTYLPSYFVATDQTG